MKFVLSMHARTVLQSREIEPAWVQRALDHPERTEPDDDDAALVHHLISVPERDGRVLRVIAETRSERARVVTAFFDRSMRGKL